MRPDHQWMGSLAMQWRLRLVLALGVGVIAGAAPAAEQVRPANPAQKTLIDAANALGMVRGLERSLTIVNMFAFTANGTMTDPKGGAPYKVTKIVADYDYVIPAARVEVERTGPDGKTEHDIAVAAGQLAWDESKPGVYLRAAAASAAERLRQLWLLPHAIVLLGAKAPDKVNVTASAGVKELAVALPDGTELNSLLDAKNFPTHVEFQAGGKTFSADFSDYKDFAEYGVMFPSHIVQMLDGRVVADLTVTDALPNPYMVFPPPKELAQKPSP
jgi:hypothetical protein